METSTIYPSPPRYARSTLKALVLLFILMSDLTALRMPIMIARMKPERVIRNMVAFQRFKRECSSKLSWVVTGEVIVGACMTETVLMV